MFYGGSRVMKLALIRILKGIAIGASMMVPGVSGGTMAIILGIYDELVHAISDLTRHFRKNAVLPDSIRSFYRCFLVMLFPRPTAGGRQQSRAY